MIQNINGNGIVTDTMTVASLSEPTLLVRTCLY